jgi:hypothetical protein
MKDIVGHVNLVALYNPPNLPINQTKEKEFAKPKAHPYTHIP